MNTNSCIVVTGAAGFIGSCMVQYLNEQGYHNLILVDDFNNPDKDKNWKRKQYLHIVERKVFFNWLNEYSGKVDLIIHLGARTDTTEFDYSIHAELNLQYSKEVWLYCAHNTIALIYASSAATYGSGEWGYNDSHEIVNQLQPLNPYGISKNEFDKWALKQVEHPPFWAGLKFFNIYGPNEYHKGRMASVIWHAFNQIKASGTVKLFKSHRKGFNDGEQLRDFVYVMDLLKVMHWMAKVMSDGGWDAPKNGLYNVGTGKARSFRDLVNATFSGLNIQPSIQFIDIPADIRDKYQYFTEANMAKLHAAGYKNSFYTLEAGVSDYVRNYLITGTVY